MTVRKLIRLSARPFYVISYVTCRSLGSIHGRGLSRCYRLLDVSSVGIRNTLYVSVPNAGTRLAFVTLKNNLMVLSLRAMMTQFLVLMLIAAFCFGGFLYALWT
jgi:hypothetical protein